MNKQKIKKVFKFLLLQLFVIVMSVLIGIEIAKMADSAAIGKVSSFFLLFLLTWVVVLGQFLRIKSVKVKDLIDLLSNYDPEDIVVVSGYEGGFTETISVYETELYLNVFTEWYYGEHDNGSFLLDKSKKYEKSNAVVISR